MCLAKSNEQAQISFIFWVYWICHFQEVSSSRGVYHKDCLHTGNAPDVPQILPTYWAAHVQVFLPSERTRLTLVIKCSSLSLISFLCSPCQLSTSQHGEMWHLNTKVNAFFVSAKNVISESNLDRERSSKETKEVKLSRPLNYRQLQKPEASLEYCLFSERVKSNPERSKDDSASRMN